MRRACFPRRPGFLLNEALVALMIVIALMAGAHQIVRAVDTQQRAALHRSVAQMEAVNLMEDLFSRAWEEIEKTEKPVQLELSERAQQVLPQPQITCEITADPQQNAARRIQLAIDWRLADGTRSPPVRLIAWRYREQEPSR